MTNHPNRSRKTDRRRIRGDWYVNGYEDNLNRSRWLDILVVDGKAYDPELYGRAPEEEAAIVIDADDHLSAWGVGVTFGPDEGEVDRVGRGLFGAG